MRIVNVMQRYTIKEAAAYIGASPTSLRRWERQGKITPERTPGGDRRYTKQQLDELLNTNHNPKDQNNV